MPSGEYDQEAGDYDFASVGGRFVTGVASGRLFSLLVAGSSMEGVDPFESPESLASLTNEMRRLLQEASR
jgi:hypothetical protein